MLAFVPQAKIAHPGRGHRRPWLRGRSIGNPNSDDLAATTADDELAAGNSALSREDLHHARQLADQVAVGLSNARLIEELDHVNWGALTALARAIDAKSPWTAGHAERVTELAIQIGPG